MLSKKIRLKALLFVVFILLSGCGTIEKTLIFQKNTSSEEQEPLKTEEQELQTEERRVLQDIEKNLEFITLNITKLSDENAKTFDQLTSKINMLEATVAELQIALASKEEIDIEIVNQNKATNQLGREDFQAAFELLKEGDYEAARNSFVMFTELYQESEFIDDAKYWLAETYYAQRLYAKALEEFENIQIQFPDSGKIPETILKSGFCHFELGNAEQAKRILNLVMNQYPNTSVARLAVQKLKTINPTAK